MFCNGTQVYKDVVQIDMEESTDTVAKDGGHQLLESRGCTAVTVWESVFLKTV